MCGVRMMVRVSIDRRLSTKVAEWFGPAITAAKADDVLADARALAAARAVSRDPGVSVAGDLSLSKHYHGIDTDVCLDVEGRDGSNVAVEHEWGAWNEQRHRFVEGHHVMRDAARMNGGY